MRNRLASLIVVKQEPTNSLGTPTHPLTAVSTVTTNLTPTFEINNNQLFSDNGNISIKTELNAYEINNNHVVTLNDCNYQNVYHHHQQQQQQHHQQQQQHQQHTQEHISPTAQLIYPCRNLFPDGCDISHHNHLNCSNYATFNANLNESTTLLYNSQSDKFILKSEPLAYGHSSPQQQQSQQHQQQHNHYQQHQQQHQQQIEQLSLSHSCENPTDFATAAAEDNQWCLTSLNIKKSLNNFNTDFEKSNHNNNHSSRHNTNSNSMYTFNFIFSLFFFFFGCGKWCWRLNSIFFLFLIFPFNRNKMKIKF